MDMSLAKGQSHKDAAFSEEPLSSVAIICPTRAHFHLESEQETGLGGIEGANIALAEGLSALGHEVTLFSRMTGERRVRGVLNRPLEAFAPTSFDALISSNDARFFAGSAPATRRYMWMHNPMALEKAFRRGQILPLARHRPVGVFVGRRLMQRTSRLLMFGARIEIGLGVNACFLETPVSAARRNRFVFASQPHRGLRPLLAAWAEALPGLPPDAEFHVFGSKAEDIGMGPAIPAAMRVIFHGRVRKPDLAGAYAEARAMLAPGAEVETFCLAAAEAQCMGLPVLTLGIGSLAERVEHGENGLICASHAALVAAGASLCANTALARKLEAGAMRQRGELGWAAVARRWHDLVTADPDRPQGRAAGLM
jgi:hypothetical protein